MKKSLIAFVIAYIIGFLTTNTAIVVQTAYASESTKQDQHMSFGKNNNNFDKNKRDDHDDDKNSHKDDKDDDKDKGKGGKHKPKPPHTPRPTPTSCPSDTPEPSPTPEPEDPEQPEEDPEEDPGEEVESKTSKLGFNVNCDNAQIEVTYDAYEYNNPVKDVKVTFEYQGDVKVATTNENGRAAVFYDKNGDESVYADAEKDFPWQSMWMTMPTDCPAGIGGQVLGASIDTYADTGVAAPYLMQALAGISFLSLWAGSAVYAKTKKEA